MAGVNAHRGLRGDPDTSRHPERFTPCGRSGQASGCAISPEGLARQLARRGRADCPPYQATRAFWEHTGFVPIDTIDPLSGWQPGNPAAIYVAALRPTR
jgi:hypothetical protein